MVVDFGVLPVVFAALFLAGAFLRAAVFFRALFFFAGAALEAGFFFAGDFLAAVFFLAGMESFGLSVKQISQDFLSTICPKDKA